MSEMRETNEKMKETQAEVEAEEKAKRYEQYLELKEEFEDE